MFDEEDYLPISALQHLLFCRRQCALIHLERLWVENRLTVEGRLMHDKAHGGGVNTRARVRTARRLVVCSPRLGIWGYTDVVEFHLTPAGEQPFPIEYKRGRPKKDYSDRVQLCAQALCLEDMLQTAVPAGGVFYGRTRRRMEVLFCADLRARTEETVRQLHELIASGKTPTAHRERKCDRCSLLHVCLPDAAGKRRTVGSYVRRTMASLQGDVGPHSS